MAATGPHCRRRRQVRRPRPTVAALTSHPSITATPLSFALPSSLRMKCRWRRRVRWTLFVAAASASTSPLASALSVPLPLSPSPFRLGLFSVQRRRPRTTLCCGGGGGKGASVPHKCLRPARSSSSPHTQPSSSRLRLSPKAFSRAEGGGGESGHDDGHLRNDLLDGGDSSSSGFSSKRGDATASLTMMMMDQPAATDTTATATATATATLRRALASSSSNTAAAVGINGDRQDAPEAAPSLHQSANGDTVDPKNSKTTVTVPIATTAAATTASSVVLLNVVAVLWGTQHAVIKSIVNGVEGGGGGTSIVGDDASVGPAFFTLARFLLAATAATLGIAASRVVGERNATNENMNEDGAEMQESSEVAEATPESTFDSNTLRWGLEMGLYMFLGFAFQAIGLQYTTASKSGFLLYLNVKFVPLLAYALWGRPLTGSTIGSALAAFVGTSLLATKGQFDATSVNVGDVWSVAAAMASAMFILRLERASQQAPNAAALNAASLWTVSSLSFLWWALERHDSLEWLWHDAVQDASALVQTHLPELLYLSVVATAVTNWIQTIAQRYIAAERASIIYAMDPVYGALFAHLWLGENLDGAASWIGAALIVAAAATNAWWDLPSSRDASGTETSVPRD